MSIRAGFFAIFFTMIVISLQSPDAEAVTAESSLGWNTLSHNMSGHAGTHLDYWDESSYGYCTWWEWDPNYDVEYCAYWYGVSYSVKVHASSINHQGTTTWTNSDWDLTNAYVSASATNPHSGYWTLRSNHWLNVDIVECTNNLDWGWWCYNENFDAQLGQREVEATVPCLASNTVAEFDDYAVNAALGFPSPRPWEHAVTFRCVSLAPITFEAINPNDSFAEVYPYTPPTNDPCRSRTFMPAAPATGANYGAVHSHPYFTTVSEYLRGVGCHETSEPPSLQALAAYNVQNQDFANDGPNSDVAMYQCRLAPLYLRTPLGDKVKKLQGKPSNCIATFSVVYQ